MDSTQNSFLDFGTAAYLSDTKYAYPNRRNQHQATRTAFERGYYVGLFSNLSPILIGGSRVLLVLALLIPAPSTPTVNGAQHFTSDHAMKAALLAVVPSTPTANLAQDTTSHHAKALKTQSL